MPRHDHIPARDDAASSVASAGTQREVMIPLDDVSLDATLTLPDRARAVVVFAHGSGSSRHSPRNRFVAEELQAAGLGTLLMDLLTEREDAVDEETGELRFDIGLLAARLVASDRLARVGAGDARARRSACSARAPAPRPRSSPRRGCPIASAPSCRAADGLIWPTSTFPNVKAPTLLIVGGPDEAVIDLNQRAMGRMKRETPVRLEIVPGATHLFEEPGALDRVAHLARDWFTQQSHRGRAGGLTMALGAAVPRSSRGWPQAGRGSRALPGPRRPRRPRPRARRRARGVRGRARAARAARRARRPQGPSSGTRRAGARRAGERRLSVRERGGGATVRRSRRSRSTSSRRASRPSWSARSTSCAAIGRPPT